MVVILFWTAFKVLNYVQRDAVIDLCFIAIYYVSALSWSLILAVAEPMYNQESQLTHVNFWKKKFTCISKEKSDKFSLLTLAKYICYHIDPSKIKFCLRRCILVYVFCYNVEYLLHVTGGSQVCMYQQHMAFV